MKKASGLIKFVIIMSLIMGGITAIIVYLSAVREKNNQYVDIDLSSIKLVQLEEPKDGDPIAVVNTTLGEFRFVLYPQYSPNAVKNFTELADSGYYDNTYVFNSESGAYSAAGCPQKNGELPEGYDKSKELVERELSQDLWPFKGAVCSLNTTVDRDFKQSILGGGTFFNGSRFALINTIDFDEQTQKELLSSEGGDILGKAFIEKGGIPNFSQQMTVIGQTYEGLDVIEKLASLEVTSNGIYKVPAEDVMIISVRTDVYSSK